jgi:hypothetical protein
MHSPIQAQVGPWHSQTYSETVTTEGKAQSSQNALKHGLRSAAILLPDDDAEAFDRLRRDLFHTYRPRTGDEAACVEAMASGQWRMARCRRWQAVYDAQTNALLTGDPNRLAGHICEPDSHRWIHKSMDCVLQESRLDRLMCRARDKLLLLQKERRNNLIAGAVDPEPIFWPSESPTDEAVRPPEAGGCGGNSGAVRQPEAGGCGGNSEPPVPASASQDGPIGKDDERTPRGGSDRARPLDTPQGADGWGARQRAPTQRTPGGRFEVLPRDV